MRGPKHLWSGDWERESAAVEEELASLEELPRVVAEPAGERPSPPPEPPRRRPPAWPRWRLPRVRVPVLDRRAQRWIAAVLAALLVLGGAAYGLDALISSGGNGSPAAAASGPSATVWWLGMQVESFSGGGVVIETVPPGSLGEAAGLEPGDQILEVANRAVGSSGDIVKATAGMRAGQVVEVEVSRGSTLVKSSAILGAPPSNSP